MLCAQGVTRAGDGCSSAASGSRNPFQEDPDCQRDWASMAPELLCVILHKVQERRGEAGEGRRIVACAGVCRSWRRQVHQFCHSMCRTPYIQFPSSLSQPGPDAHMACGEAPLQCLLRRKGGVMTLYHGEQRQFMLAARSKWRPGGYTFLISSHPRRCSSHCGNSFMGKLKGNFWGSEFVLWDSALGRRSPLTAIFFTEDVIDGVRQRRVTSVLVPPEQQSAACPDISLPFSLPRSQSLSWPNSLARTVSKSMQVSFTRSLSRSSSIRVLSLSGSAASHPAAPPVASAIHQHPMQGTQRGGQFLTACFSPDLILENLVDGGDEAALDGEAQYQMMLAAARRRKIAKFESMVASARRQGHSNSVVALGSKIPEWDPQLHCWSLDFKGRASLPSLHNFQLVVDAFPGPGSARDVMDSDGGTVVLQLGKIGKGLYTMDYGFPLSAVQAFAICISSFFTSVGLDP